MEDPLDLGKLTITKSNVENVTPHKVAVVAFIREFGLLKIGGSVLSPKYRKDFCILALKLIQCPDMEFKELEHLLTHGKYNLMSTHLQNFCSCLQTVYRSGVSALMHCVTSTIEKLMIEQSETCPCMITRSSVLGLYLRRIMLQLDKLTFIQLVSLYKSFCLYYQEGRPGLMIRSLSKEKLDNMEVQSGMSSTSPTMPDESKQHDLSIKMAVMHRDHAFEERQWSRKQAELFTAQQANLLQINEKKALPPKQLQKTIMEIMNDLPEYSDIHFLSFLNCLRMRELCGAQDSLYNCFDRSLGNVAGNLSTSDRNKHFRYAALNRAAMHTQFGHNEVAMEGVREALSMAAEAGDAACTAAAAAWAARAGGAWGRALLPRLPRAPRAAAAAALAAHLLAQHRAVNGVKPAEVFAMVTKGDSINYLHSMTDLTLASLSNTAALWSLYGKTEMASIYCQLLLNLNTKSGVSGGAEAGAWHWTAACAAAAAGLAAAAAWRGDDSLATALASRHQDPQIKAAAHAAAATRALYACKWEEAEQSINQLASYERWESQLLKAEMYFLKGDATESLEALHDILDYCKTEDDSLHFVSLKLRAMILQSQVEETFDGAHSMNNSNIIVLNEVLSTATKYNLHYIAATAEMHIANVQLHMGCVRSALDLVRRVLPTIMAHGGAYDMARGLLLYTKCRVSTAPGGGEARAQALLACAGALEAVKRNFLKVSAQGRLLETLYFQAQLYNEIGNVSARNQCAWMYRQLETQNPIEHSNSMLMLY
ncbi:anaphase-promoting complex subunit 5 isoform X1 [Plutella xylostella]|uniref:anaphase-promoting complex subunit 5 isoform X1 n=1 Tax=Plutella xylostella TaxID=51655 RepID=UPI002032F542|nr:anaphase-promoting complex subunit 5 isoform X1 [Plutella xylostella]